MLFLRIVILSLIGLSWGNADPLPPPPDKPTPLYPKEDLRPGMIGETYTVLQGNEIVPVKTIILGVHKGALGPGLDLIICKLDDPKTSLTEAVHGMSGSPLYIDGKLVGALSHRIATFEKDGHCGFTPIQDMLLVRDLMDARSLSPSQPPAPGLPDQLPLSTESAIDSSFQPLDSPIFVSGISPKLFRKFLQRIHPDSAAESQLVVDAGGVSAPPTDPTAPDAATVKAGSPIALLFMSGDIHMGGTGTCTWREGDKVLAFGHPMEETGSCAFPMAEATVITTIPSYEYPYKLSNVGPIVGTIFQDRASAIAGVIGKLPEMATYEVTRTSNNQPEATLKGQFITDPNRLFELTGSALLAGLEQSEQNTQKNTLSVTGQLVLANHPPLNLTGFYSGQGGEPILDLALRALTPVAKIVALKQETITAQSLTLHLDRSEAIHVWSIDSIQTDAKIYDPGATVKISVRLKNDYNAFQTREISLPLPPSLQSTKLILRVSGAEDLDQVDLQPQIDSAQTVDDLINLYNSRRATNHLYAQLVAPAKGVIVNGVALPDLPDSVSSLLTDPRASEHPSPITEQIVLEKSTEIPGYLRDSSQLIVHIR